MYHPTSFHISHVHCEHLAKIAWDTFGSLFARPGGNGTAMSPYKETIELFHHELRDVLGDCWQRASVVSLQPSAQIVAHVDEGLTGTRYHLPLQTNEGCWSFSEGIWSQLEVGSIYRMDPTKPHGAVNWGETTRLHLMIDVL